MLDLTIPGLPPINTAGPHGGSHWARTTTKRQWEGKVCAAVLEALGRWPAQPLSRARVTITRASTREPDYDNLTQGGKFILDGLVKAGVLVDDSPAVVGRPEYLWERAPRGMGSVRIQVQAVAEVRDHRDAWERGPGEGRPHFVGDECPGGHQGVEIGPRVMSSPWLDGTGSG